MLSEEIKTALQAHFGSDAEVDVSEQGGHYTVTVVSSVMQGLTPVKQQQAVYAPLSDMIADGRVHALNIRARAPDDPAA